MTLHLRWDLTRSSCMASSADLGRMLWNLRRSSIFLLTLLHINFKCSSNDKRLSRKISNGFSEQATLLLIFFSEGWSSSIILDCHLQIVWHLISRQRDRFCVLEETCPLSITICLRLLKKLNHKFKMLSDMPFCVSFKIMSSCHTLSNALKAAVHLMIYSLLYTEKRK